MLKRLIIILLLLNIFPFVYHKHFVGVHSAQAGDFFASEDNPWDGDGGGGGDGDGGGDDGSDDDDDDNCTDPGSTTSDPTLINTYITSDGQKWGTYSVTTTDNCTGVSSIQYYNALIDDCTNPDYTTVTIGEPHAFYLSGTTVYGKVTHDVYNSCNGNSVVYDEDVKDETATTTYQTILEAPGEQLYVVTANVDPTETVGPDGVTTRSANPKWPIYNETFGRAVVEWSAFYEAVQFKQGDSWKWRSLTYASTNLTSGTLPSCVEFTVNVTSSTTTISGDQSTADVNINYTVVNKLGCAYGFEVSRDLKTQFKTFQTSEGTY